MNKQFLAFAFRNIRRNKGYSLISILGLAFGMAVFFLILSFIMFETGFESSEKNAGKIYNMYWSDKNQESFYGTSPYIFAKVFRANYKSIAECAQVSEEFDYGRLRVAYKGTETIPENLFYADPQLFDILSFKTISGNINNFTGNVNSVLLSESAVTKYFHGDNLTGKFIQIKSGDQTESFMVSAVFEDRPANSQFRPDFIFNMSYFKSIMPPGFIEQWGVNNPVTYFKLRNGITSEKLLSSVKSIQKNFMPDFRKVQHFNIISLKDVHLHSSRITGFFGNRGSIQKVYIFTFIAALILIMAFINFVNLNIARASQRVKEISIRKMLGASRQKLLFQLTAESVLFSLIALPLALIFSELLAKYFYELLNCPMTSVSLFNHGFIFYLLGIPVLAGILSGLYTALYSVKKVSAEDIQSPKVISSNSLSRRLLIGFQFVVFTGLLISSLVIYKQMKLMINDDLGYNKNNLIIIDKPDDKKYNGSIDSFIDELKSRNCIVDASFASSLPPAIGSTILTKITSTTDPQNNFDAQLITCDKNYIPTMGLILMEGKNFGSPESNKNEAIINELAAKKLGLEQPVIGKSILYYGNRFRVIGEIKNFFSQSYYKPLMPIILRNSADYSYKIAVRYRSKELGQTLAAVKQLWKNFFGNSILNISFSDKELQMVYDGDLRFSKIIFLFTLVAILISVMGLASLTSITSARRRKEIGIRKVLGASIPEIMTMLGKEIFYISLIGTIIAWPLSFYLIGFWLDNYTKRTGLTAFYPLLAFALGLVIAIATISFQAYKAATADPVEALRYE